MQRTDAHLVLRISHDLKGTAFCLAMGVLTGGCDVLIWAKQWGRECAQFSPTGPGYLTHTEKMPMEKALAVALDSNLDRAQMQAIYDRFTQACTSARDAKQKVREDNRATILFRIG